MGGGKGGGGEKRRERKKKKKAVSTQGSQADMDMRWHCENSQVASSLTGKALQHAGFEIPLV